MIIVDKHTELKGGFLQNQYVHYAFIPKHKLAPVSHALLVTLESCFKLQE